MSDELREALDALEEALEALEAWESACKMMLAMGLNETTAAALGAAAQRGAAVLAALKSSASGYRPA